VTVRAGSLPLERPLMVQLVAMASAEVRWNGVVIGRNGMPGADAARERPGRFVAGFIVPPALVRPGNNLLEVHLSAHHLWLPVRRPVHLVGVGPYVSDPLPGLADYLPALLALGGLVASGLYFAAAWGSDRRDRQALLLALAAGAATLQLIAEVSRAFVAYSYPWHLARVGAVALLAAGGALPLLAYAALRFAPEWRRPAVLCAAAASAVGLLAVPWYDLKALSAIVAAAIAAALCAARGVAKRRSGARAGLAAALAALVLVGWQLTDFLDRGWFLLLATLLAALVAEQVTSLRTARAERDDQRRRASALAERLAKAERQGEPIIALKDGSRTHRVTESDIVYIRAADDYCEVVLSDGREMLVTMSLARLLATLPARFLRVHKSYAVNRAHVAETAPRPGGGRLLRLSDGSRVPVGRSYGAAVAAILESALAPKTA
jgi:hypothetical protein